MKRNYASGIINVHTIERINNLSDIYRVQIVGLGGGILHQEFESTKEKVMSTAYFWNTNTRWPIKDHGVLK